MVLNTPKCLVRVMIIHKPLYRRLMCSGAEETIDPYFFKEERAMINDSSHPELDDVDMDALWCYPEKKNSVIMGSLGLASWASSMGSKIAWLNTTGLLSVGLCEVGSLLLICV